MDASEKVRVSLTGHCMYKLVGMAVRCSLCVCAGYQICGEKGKANTQGSVHGGKDTKGKKSALVSFSSSFTPFLGV